MIKTNEITPEIQKSVDRKNLEFAIQSIDANRTGTKAVLVGIYEDPDFPEMFIYDAKTGKSRKINSGSEFVDFPMGKAFWAENGKDVYVNRHDCDSLYIVRFDTKNYKLSSFHEIQDKSQYIEEKLKEVTDFIWSNNNYAPPALIPGDNPYEKCLMEFVSDIVERFHIHRRLSQAGQNPGRWNNMTWLGSDIYVGLKDSAEKFGISERFMEQIQKMEELLQPFESVFKPVIGKCYELKWGKFLHEGKLQDWASKVRIEGESREHWILMDSNAPLDAEFHELPVVNWSEIWVKP